MTGGRGRPGALGRAGEELVAALVRASRVTSPRPQLALSARASSISWLLAVGTFVFCEVKTRRSTAFGAPVEAVTLTKQRRLRRLALRWLSEHPQRQGQHEVRFDVVSVSLTEAPRRSSR